MIKKVYFTFIIREKEQIILLYYLKMYLEKITNLTFGLSKYKKSRLGLITMKRLWIFIFVISIFFTSKSGKCVCNSIIKLSEYSRNDVTVKAISMAFRNCELWVLWM